MVNKHVSENIDDARDCIKDGLYSEAEIVLNNNKAFIHDDPLKKKIFEVEQRTLMEYYRKRNEAEKDIDNSNPWKSYNKYANYDLQLRLWRVQELLAFWDETNKKL